MFAINMLNYGRPAHFNLLFNIISMRKSVKVLDENDNTPVIQAPQIIEITEYHDTNDIIMSVKVTDGDDPAT